MSIYIDRDLKRLLEEIKNSNICQFNKEKILEHTTEQSVSNTAKLSLFELLK